MGMIQETLDLLNGTNVAGRQRQQWQGANQHLDDAIAALNNGDSETAIAAALIGLLSLQLSRT